MGVITYIKIGVVVLAFLVGGWVVHKYYAPKLATLEASVKEQHDVINTYEKNIGVDKETQDVHQEIQKARDANNIPRMLDAFKRLRDHQRGIKNKAPASTDDNNE